jgi:hypothetical protein
LEVVPSLLVPIDELTRSSSKESLLPEAISEALGISLNEVMELYFQDNNEEAQEWRVGEAVERCREREEGRT